MEKPKKTIINKDSFEVGFFRVTANDREVPHWCQPLVRSLHNGKVILYCQVIDNILQFLVAPSSEIGFAECVQYGPSINIIDNNICSNRINVNEYHVNTIAEYWQSDEGGRFYHSKVHYSLKEIDQDVKLTIPENFRWMTLNEIYKLLPIKGVFNNEFRSVLSLILKYLY